MLMDRKITTWCIGVLITLFAFPAEYLYSSIQKPMLDSVYYYLKIDTVDSHIGYLRTDFTGVNPIVDNVKGNFAMWNIKKDIEDPNLYVLIHRMSQDTLKFVPPSTVEDTIAINSAEGILKYWNMIFNEGEAINFFTSYKDDASLITYNYYLTMSKDGIVNLSSDTSSMGYNRLNFVPERVSVIPDVNKYYRLVVDTLGFPDLTDVFSKWNVLSADISSRPDSLVVKDTILSGDRSLWKFEVDMVVYDTTFFKVRNKVTDSILAFDIPANGIDTIAYIDTTGTVKQWGLPFFFEDGNRGKLMVRDTTNKKDYYLAYKDSTVKLTSNASDANCLKFVLVEEKHIQNFFDSTAIYRVKYITGIHAGKFLASNDRGDTTTVNSVFAHTPDGQFIVNRQNHFHLANRLSNVTTARNGATNDSLKLVYDADSIPVRNQFANGVDTFEITPITYGNIDDLKFSSNLGYKFLTPFELSDSSYIFSSCSVDTLMGRIMGYSSADSTVIILSEGDTARFTLQRQQLLYTGAQSIGRIPRLLRSVYSLRSVGDTTLFVAKSGNNLVVDTLPNMAMFYIKEDTIPNRYYFIDYITGTPLQNKILINSSKQLNLAAIDSTVTHSFIIKALRLRAPEEPDDYTYLKVFPENKGKGFYEFRIIEPQSQENKWLTKNFDNYAVLGKEGESMLRAGSYTPYDLHLWVDTARGTGFNPEKPSFYIVKGVDKEAANFDDYKIEGYFLHVMDSTSLVDYDDYVFDDGEDIFYRADFVKAKRHTADELLLLNGDAALLRDSVGFAGKNEKAINEYRFYLQESDEADKYFIVTEAGYGDGGKTIARGYLSVSAGSNKLYFGPRGANAARITFESSTVSNVIVKPPVIEEAGKNIFITGGTGQITIRNAMGQEVVVYNVIGQPVTKKSILSDNESMPASRGIMIVKLGTTTRKVVVK